MLLVQNRYFGYEHYLYFSVLYDSYVWYDFRMYGMILEINKWIIYENKTSHV